MLKRFVRRALQRCGIRLRFSDVICAEHAKSIAIGSDGLAKVTVREKLVFLSIPEAGDLHDTCTIDPETGFENFTRDSPDSIEGGRRRVGASALAIDWMPNAAVTRYALHEHLYSWFPAGSQLQPALVAEYHCDVRTGQFLCELITPQTFEAAVVFERPRWPRLSTERRIVRYALKKIEGGGGRPDLCDNGQRIEWRTAEPTIGARYMCVAFHEGGMMAWGDELRSSSLAGRVRRLVGRPAPG
jgi:hypothetical protein